MNARIAERLRYRLRIHWFEFSISPFFRFCAALFFTAAGTVALPLSTGAANRLLCWAHYALTYARDGRDHLSVFLKRRVEGMLKRNLSGQKFEISGNVSPAAVHKGIEWLAMGILVLKAPAPAPDGRLEKGVLVLKNSDRFGHFRNALNVTRFLKQYELVLEPSWSGYADPRILGFAAYRETIFAMASCDMDFEFLKRMNTHILPLRMGASDWANPGVFRPLENRTKRFDAVFIARWVVMKRHHLLLKAIRCLNDPSYRLAIAAPTDWADPGLRDSVLAEIDRMGMANRVALFEDLNHEQLNEVYNESKVNILLSRQEGANRALREGFFAGIPGLVLSDFIGLSEGHINAKTGLIVAEHELAGALAYFRDSYQDFNPRSWALANVSPEVSTARLNEALAREARSKGKPWTRDIVCKCNAPELSYYPNPSAGKDLPQVSEVFQEFLNQ